MKTQDQIREEFQVYFEHLKTSQVEEGSTVNKKVEWDRFIEHYIEIGMIPKTATSWKYSRKL